MKQLDYSPLSQRVSLTDAKPFIREVVDITAMFILSVWFFLALIITLSMLQVSAPPFFYVLLNTMLFIAVFMVLKSTVNKAVERVKVTRFAAKNNIAATFDTKDPDLPGLYFEEGTEKRLVSSLDFADEGTKLGQYTYVTGSGKSRQNHSVLFARYALSRKLPHIVLDNKKNNFWNMTNLPAYFDKSQRLSLEGDFNSHFTLYAPKEYEADALYIFTPNVMANFIDNGLKFDAEIIDNYLYIYSESTEFADEKFLRTAYESIHALGAKIENQSDYYKDARVATRAENIVAQDGRRLKHGVSILAIIGLVLFLPSMIPNFTQGEGQLDGPGILTAIVASIIVIAVFWRVVRRKK